MEFYYIDANHRIIEYKNVWTPQYKTSEYTWAFYWSGDLSFMAQYDALYTALKFIESDRRY